MSGLQALQLVIGNSPMVPQQQPRSGAAPPSQLAMGAPRGTPIVPAVPVSRAPGANMPIVAPMGAPLSSHGAAGHLPDPDVLARAIAEGSEVPITPTGLGIHVSDLLTPTAAQQLGAALDSQAPRYTRDSPHICPRCTHDAPAIAGG